MSTPTEGEAARLASLLWTQTTAVGRSGLTLAAVIETAVAVADAEGLAACTMRRIAESAGVGTMTLYHYAPSRDDLVALMLDHIAAQTYADRGLPREQGSVRAALAHVAECHWQHLMAHPWVCEVSPGRPVVGPGETQRFEHELEPLEGQGLSDHDMDALLGAVVNLVHATARWQIGLEGARTTTRLSDEQWWAATWPVLARHLDPAAYPVASRVGATVASAGDPRRVLDFGLAAILAGLDDATTL